MNQISLMNWSAWAPGLPERDQWRSARTTDEYLEALTGTEAPEVKWVHARRRRRCSKLTRVALKTGFDCCEAAGVDPGEVKTVFATRHGEINLTLDLLKTLADDELLSPMSFGNSVHNTPSSYFCMCAENHHASRTVSACEDTFQHGVIDAVNLLDLSPDLPVLFVFTHASPPDPLDRFDAFQDASWGVSLLLSGSSDAQQLSFSLRKNKDGNSNKLPPSIAFLNWVLHDDSRKLQLAGTDKTLSWVWTRSDATTSEPSVHKPEDRNNEM